MACATTKEELQRVLHADVVAAARALLGWDLVRGNRRARIVETEAYRASDDPASHAHRGKTPRNAVMFGEPGRSYVYFTYGNHWMFNVVAHAPDDAAGVLIRAARPLAGIEEMRPFRSRAIKDGDLLSGPGKLCQAFEITRDDNDLDLMDEASTLHLEPGEPVHRVLVGTRIGIALGKGHETPWRFIDADQMRWASKPWPKL